MLFPRHNVFIQPHDGIMGFSLDLKNNWQAKLNKESLYVMERVQPSKKIFLIISSVEGPVLPAMSFPARITTALVLVQ
jgi:hypothetical protein